MPNYGSEVQLQLLKDLELETLSLIFGYTTTGGGNENLAVATSNRLTVSGSHPLSFGGDRGSWASIRLEADAALEFPAAAHTFDSYNTTYSHSYSKAHGFRPMTGLNGYVDFTGVAATITLGDISGYSQRYPYTQAPPCIDLGYQALRVRSDQTWSNPSGTGLIRCSVARNELGPDEFHNIMVTSISPDGLLPDLSAVPFRVERSDTVGNASVYHIPAGSYQSLDLYSSGHNWTHGATTYFDGDVEFTGGTLTVLMDGTYAAGVEQTDISLYFHNNARAQYVNLNGHTVTTARGVLLENNDLTHYSERMYVDASGATLNIGGDLIYNSKQGYAGSATEQVDLGISGDSDTVINLHGSFRTNARARNVDHLSLSTVNLLGGTPEAPNEFEACDDPASSLGPQTYAIGTLNVGTSALATAYVILVNSNLNESASGVKDGEVLLTGTLTIGPGSTLDLNRCGVRVESGFSMGTEAALDLNTGDTLAAGMTVSQFVGTGDQTAEWVAFADRVIDSSNPGAAFASVVVDGKTYWQVRAFGTLLTVR